MQVTTLVMDEPMPGVLWRSSFILLLLPVPVRYGHNIKTINQFQAASLVQFSSVVLAFTAMNWSYSKTLDVTYNTVSFFYLRYELADSG